MKKNFEVKNDIKGLVKGVLQAALIGLLAMLILSVIHAVAVHFFNVTDSINKLVSFLGWGICGFLSGYIALRTIGEKGILYGAITGVCLFLLALILGVISTGSLKNFSDMWGNLLISVVSAAAGGIVGVNKK